MKVKLIVIGVALLGVIIASFDLVSEYLYSNTDGTNPKGLLATTYLSILGGCGVIYGFLQTSRKIGEQTRQNDIARRQADIAASNNNDKRFGDAIGYLNSDNVGIAIGGVYALFQLAKEDNEERYKDVIANVYLNFLSRHSCEQINDKLYDTIIKILLSDIFDSANIIFEKLVFNNLYIKGVANRVFTNCKFSNVSICDSNNCKFINSIIVDIYFEKSSNLIITHCDISNCRLFSLSKDYNLENINIFGNTRIAQMEIKSLNSINKLRLVDTELGIGIHIVAPIIKESFIETNSLITVITNTPKGITIAGNKKFVNIMNPADALELKKQAMIDEVIEENIKTINRSNAPSGDIPYI